MTRLTKIALTNLATTAFSMAVFVAVYILVSLEQAVLWSFLSGMVVGFEFCFKGRLDWDERERRIELQSQETSFLTLGPLLVLLLNLFFIGWSPDVEPFTMDAMIPIPIVAAWVIGAFWSMLFGKGVGLLWYQRCDATLMDSKALRRARLKMLPITLPFMLAVAMGWCVLLRTSMDGASGAKSPAPAKMITKLAIVDGIRSAFDGDEREALFAAMSEAVMDVDGAYPESAFRQIGEKTVLACDALPNGAWITRGVAREMGTDESGRVDIDVTMFHIPDVGRAVLTGGILSKGRSGQSFSVYQLSRCDELLVICESSSGQLGGGIDFVFWNLTTGEVEEIGGWHGDFDGRDFAYAMTMAPDGPALTIYGLFEVKRKAYEPDRARLEAALGMPVAFECIPGS